MVGWGNLCLPSRSVCFCGKSQEDRGLRRGLASSLIRSELRTGRECGLLEGGVSKDVCVQAGRCLAFKGMDFDDVEAFVVSFSEGMAPLIVDVDSSRFLGVEFDFSGCNVGLMAAETFFDVDCFELEAFDVSRGVGVFCDIDFSKSLFVDGNWVEDAAPIFEVTDGFFLLSVNLREVDLLEQLAVGHSIPFEAEVTGVFLDFLLLDVTDLTGVDFIVFDPSDSSVIVAFSR